MWRFCWQDMFFVCIHWWYEVLVHTLHEHYRTDRVNRHQFYWVSFFLSLYRQKTYVLHTQVFKQNLRQIRTYIHTLVPCTGLLNFSQCLLLSQTHWENDVCSMMKEECADIDNYRRCTNTWCCHINVLSPVLVSASGPCFDLAYASVKPDFNTTENASVEKIVLTRDLLWLSNTGN